MQRTLYLMLLLATFFYACTPSSDHETNPLIAQLDSLIMAEHEANRFDGTIVIGTQDSILFEKAVGLSNRVWNIPMRMDHRFDICSFNKSFAAVLTLLAVEEGKLSLDDRLIDLLDDYDIQGIFNPMITLHQMLTHTSGLPDYDGVSQDLSKDDFRMLKRQHFENDEYVNFISQLPAKSPPGERFYYSNFAYHLLLIILEDTYNLSFDELLKQKITEPLHLTQTFSTTSTRAIFEQVVEGYNYEKDSNTWKRNQFIDLTLGRRIFSTSHDLYQWGRAMSGPGLLNEASMNLLLSNHLDGITSDISYGYGWVVFDGNGNYRMGDLGIDKNYIIHGGATEGYKSMLINIENGEYIIAFLANTGAQTNEIKLAQKLSKLLINSAHEN